MEFGIDSFAATMTHPAVPLERGPAVALLLARIEHADTVGLEVFGLGEHHREEFLDSASHMLLAAAASRTRRIRLTSAVSVLSAADPVRVFQNFATLDLISNGRAEIVAGRGSSVEAFPLFGFDLQDYDALFSEKLELLLQIRDNHRVSWSGRFRAPLEDQPVYPRPLQERLPIWVGVGGTPASFRRAGVVGAPLMVAVIGGETQRFAPLVDLYRSAWGASGHPPGASKVGLHSLGYVAETTQEAVADYYPGYKEAFTRLGRERGFPPVTRHRFDAQNGPTGAFLVGSPEEVAAKIIRHSAALGGISRVTFQMDVGGLTHEQLMRSYELIATRVAPIVNRHEAEMAAAGQ